MRPALNTFMKSFYEMLQIIESYRDIEHDPFDKEVGALNMTSRLPVPTDGDIFGALRGLTRGFHLNTIIGRMFQPWSVGLKFAPRRWDLYEKTGKKEDVYKWSVSEEDHRANNNYKAALSMFKQEIANAVTSLPDKQGFDVVAQKHRDVLGPSKNFLKDILAEQDSDLIDSLRNAYNIFYSVFGPRYSDQARNFANFIQIVREELMRYKETLPTMGDDEEDDMADNPYVQALKQEEERYMDIHRKEL